jgi:hypothetical protein
MAVLATAGCEGTRLPLGDDQTVATLTALRRGQVELACPQAAPTLISISLLEPIAWHGGERAEYTVAVTGCSKRVVYVSVCQLGSPACLAARAPQTVNAPP